MLAWLISGVPVLNTGYDHRVNAIVSLELLVCGYSLLFWLPTASLIAAYGFETVWRSTGKNFSIL